MTLFLTLLLAHILGDFCLQPDSWVADKQLRKHKSTRLYTHILIHTVLLSVFLGFDPTYWAGFLLIIVTHYLIDLAKLYTENSRNAIYYFLIDQALHVSILAIVTHQYEPFVFSVTTILSPQLLLLLTALAVVIFVPAVLIRILIAQWRPATNDKQVGTPNKEDESLIKAGRFIGILERLFVFIFIATNHWEAIGFLLAAKSIFRFGDLRQGKERKLTEYVLIGTLLSFGIAILLGLAYLYLRTLLA